ncbi:fructose-2,6-bisphosphatase [Iris pallida]|uniref:Fructose-2,6-bisphosphatase n=1 Tax=Iris pallida TaxID=29817 RepID=A0AAX6IM89_IRIPA|nr:fructose-2,6-bisphosphatase [Iris pallida]
MGSSFSQLPEDEDEDDDHHRSKEKVLEQEPEFLPCHASASPLSAAATPRGGGGAHLWDPCSPSSLLLLPSRSFRGDPVTAEVVLVTEGESAASLRPDLVTGRWPGSALTGSGERQGRALAVFLKSQGVRFSEVYCSPLDRARSTARFVCRELGFAAEQIQSSDALVEMSHGQWEGCLRSEIYTPEMLSLIDRTQPDFSAPSGESLRQVQFRMVEFLNRTVLRLQDKLISGDAVNHNEAKGGFSRNSSTNSVQDRDVPQWDLTYRLNRLQRKKSGKSRLQVVTSGDNEAEEDFSQREANDGHIPQDPTSRSSVTSIGIFTHSTPIKCLLAGLLGSSPATCDRFCIDDSSVTVLQHSLRTGWKLKRMNDTSHLRLLLEKSPPL